MDSVRRLPYRLNEWTGTERPVLIPEGEKDVDRLFSLGLPATCNPGGAGKWPKGFAPRFSGTHVVLLPDNDQPGRDHARQVTDCLLPVAASVRILELPGLPEKGDVSDWLDAGHTVDELVRLVGAAPLAVDVLSGWAKPEPLGAVEGSTAFDLSHDSLALGLERELQSEARHVALWGRWLFWTGERLKPDESLEHMTRTRDYLRRRAEALVRASARGEIRSLDVEKAEKAAKALRSAQTVANVVGLARSNVELVATAEQWDRAAFRIGTPNARRSQE